MPGRPAAARPTTSALWDFRKRRSSSRASLAPKWPERAIPANSRVSCEARPGPCDCGPFQNRVDCGDVVAASAGAPSVAITFDDGPDVVKRGAAAIAENDAILAALDGGEAEERAVRGRETGRHTGGAGGGRAWGKAGHLVANHSYSHRNLRPRRRRSKTSRPTSVRNEELLRKLPGFSRLFRFPFLKEGDTWRNATASARSSAADTTAGARRPSTPATGTTTSVTGVARGASGRRSGALSRRVPRAPVGPGAVLRALSKRAVGPQRQAHALLHTNAINAAFLPT